jgi:hypothetical protein
VTYDYRRDEFPEKGFSSGSQLGWIAQDIEKVIPELVTTDDHGYYYVSYSHGAALVGQAVTELSQKVDKVCDLSMIRKEFLEKIAEKDETIAAISKELELVKTSILEMQKKFAEFQNFSNNK